MEYEIRIRYSTIADLKREAARLLGEDLDVLQRDLDAALDDAATLRESLDASRKKLDEALREAALLRAAASTAPLPKPERVEAGQWWQIDGTTDEHKHPFRVDRMLEVTAAGYSDTGHMHIGEMSMMLTDSRWRYLGNGERPFEPGAPAPAAPPIPGPTARDGVVGMLVRCGWGEPAERIAKGTARPADVAEQIRRLMGPELPERDAACIVALEALAARERCPVGHGAGSARAEYAPSEQPAGSEWRGLPPWRGVAHDVRRLWSWPVTWSVEARCGLAGAYTATFGGPDAEARAREYAAWVSGPAEQPASVASLGDRERLGRVVREIWISWAREQPSPKPSWLPPWEALSEPDREVDRRIGEQLFSMGLTAGRAEAKEEREALRKRVRELEAALTCREEDVDRVSLERDAYQMSTEEGFEVAARLRAEAQHAREQGASEMRERAAQMVCNEGRAGCLRAVPHLAQQVVDAILSLPIDCAKMEEKR